MADQTPTPGAAAPTFLPASACKFRDQPDPCAWPMCDCTQVGLRACERLLELGWWESATVADLTEELTEARAQNARLEADLSRARGEAGDNGCTANHWARQAELKDEALDEIALTVGYIVLHHGTMTAQDLADTITRIGNIARAARDGHSVKEGAGHD